MRPQEPARGPTHLKVDFIQLHHSDRLTSTHVPACPKNQLYISAHLGKPGLVKLKKTLRPEGVRVLTEQLLQPHHSRIICSNVGSSGNEVAENSVTSRGNLLLHYIRGRRAHPNALVDDSLVRRKGPSQQQLGRELITPAEVVRTCRYGNSLASA